MKATIRNVTLVLNQLIPIRRYLLGISCCNLVKIPASQDDFMNPTTLSAAAIATFGVTRAFKKTGEILG
jgi:hypothetical protein